jgi:hypothetical protein
MTAFLVESIQRKEGKWRRKEQERYRSFCPSNVFPGNLRRRRRKSYV